MYSVILAFTVRYTVLAVSVIAVSLRLLKSKILNLDFIVRFCSSCCSSFGLPLPKSFSSLQGNASIQLFSCLLFFLPLDVLHHFEAHLFDAGIRIFESHLQKFFFCCLRDCFVCFHSCSVDLGYRFHVIDNLLVFVSQTIRGHGCTAGTSICSMLDFHCFSLFLGGLVR